MIEIGKKYYVAEGLARHVFLVVAQPSADIYTVEVLASSQPGKTGQIESLTAGMIELLIRKPTSVV
jgi:hypothetical protein